MTDAEKLLSQVETLLLPLQGGIFRDKAAEVVRRYQNTLTLTKNVYGATSSQEDALVAAMKQARDRDRS